jgi:hypothetical protein
LPAAAAATDAYRSSVGTRRGNAFEVRLEKYKQNSWPRKLAAINKSRLLQTKGAERQKES